MMIRWNRFNIYLLALLAGLMAACETTGGNHAGKKGKEAATLSIYVESHRELLDRTVEISVYRDNPVKLLIEKEPRIDVRHLEKVEVVDTPKGFIMVVKMNSEGKLLLQSLSLGERGKRIVIESMFTETRYLGAFYLPNNISDGVLAFQPDASRPEAERIVRGINNVIKEINK